MTINDEICIANTTSYHKEPEIFQNSFNNHLKVVTSDTPCFSQLIIEDEPENINKPE